MNGRKIFREYAQSLGKEAKEFVEIRTGWYDEPDVLVTKNNNRQLEETSFNYRNMVHWLINTNRIKDTLKDTQ